jgi:hypothetical protein
MSEESEGGRVIKTAFDAGAMPVAHVQFATNDPILN